MWHARCLHRHFLASSWCTLPVRSDCKRALGRNRRNVIWANRSTAFAHRLIRSVLESASLWRLEGWHLQSDELGSVYSSLFLGLKNPLLWHCMTNCDSLTWLAHLESNWNTQFRDDIWSWSSKARDVRVGFLSEQPHFPMSSLPCLRHAPFAPRGEGLAAARLACRSAA